MTDMIFPIDRFKERKTPFYYYDTRLLNATLDAIERELDGFDNFNIHYAVKANANPDILATIANRGFGADCVSGEEIDAAVAAGIARSKIVFAGVGKTDDEINKGLDYDIACFNVESLEELAVIDELSGLKGKKANVAIRFNPDIKANTIEQISTGRKENKFGISVDLIDSVADALKHCENIVFKGIHIHIGSQILEMGDFVKLAATMNGLAGRLTARGLDVESINVGGGLGIDYHNPDEALIPDFKSYFDVFKRYLNLSDGQTVHFELGRSVVAQCGSLISRVVYVKQGCGKKFVILDAGMNDLVRPAMYKAYHAIDNLTSDGNKEAYDVVGPVCESSDVFAKDMMLNAAVRGDLVAIRSAGAYGEVMSSNYNLRPYAQRYTDLTV